VLQGKTVVAVTSGANINFQRLRLVAELADVGAMTEATLTTTIPERPGGTDLGKPALPVQALRQQQALCPDQAQTFAHLVACSGAFREFIALATSSGSIPVTEFIYRCATTIVSGGTELLKFGWH
jgi:threonine dehydratase